MTDETAYENFKKYGNPDGPGSYSVAIALPRYLLQKENQIFVLLCAFVILLVLIPGAIYINFGDTTIKDENGILLENKKAYGAKLNESIIPKNMPMMLASCIEFQDMGVKSEEENKLLKRLKDDDAIADMLPNTVSRRSKNMNYKPMLLILGHLFDKDEVKAPEFASSMREILKNGVGHLNMMIDVG